MSGVTPETGVRSHSEVWSLESLRSLMSGVWSHSGVWSLASGVTPETGVRRHSGVWILGHFGV